MKDLDGQKGIEGVEVEDLDGSLGMSGFFFIGMAAFIFWYMLRQCKKQKEETHDPRNPQSRGQYRPAELDVDTSDYPKVELSDYV